MAGKITTYVYPCHGGYTGEARDDKCRHLAKIFPTRDEALAEVAAIAKWIAGGRLPNAWWYARL